MAKLFLAILCLTLPLMSEAKNEEHPVFYFDLQFGDQRSWFQLETDGRRLTGELKGEKREIRLSEKDYLFLAKQFKIFSVKDEAIDLLCPRKSVLIRGIANGKSFETHQCYGITSLGKKAKELAKGLTIALVTLPSSKKIRPK
jgi:hypothetical protein